MDKLCHIILSITETHHPLTLHTDGGGKFFNGRLDLWLNDSASSCTTIHPRVQWSCRVLSAHFNGPCEVLPYRCWTTRQVVGRSLCSCNLPSQCHSCQVNLTPTRCESKVSLDDVPAPENTLAPTHTPTSTIPACTSGSLSISSPTLVTTSQLSCAGSRQKCQSLFVSYLNQQYHGMALALDIPNHRTPLPTTLSEVLVSSAKTEWLASMKHEFDTIILNGTFELFPLPPGQKALGPQDQA